LHNKIMNIKKIKSCMNRLIDCSCFTLIETIVTMLILSIIIAIAMPNFNKILSNYQLDISAREMASDIRDVQQAAAKTQSSTYSIRWDTGTGTYYLHKSDLQYYKSVKLPSSIELSYTPLEGDEFTKLNFNITGIPRSGFGGTVKLKDKSTGKEKFVIVNKLGRVRVSDTPPAE
jgi:Tfp pilus assembly protein FimT